MSTKPVPKGPIEVALGQRFREVRQRQSVTLKDLATALDVSVNMIRWHEAGDRMMRADLIVKASEVMGVRPEELLQEQNEEEAAPAAQE